MADNINTYMGEAALGQGTAGGQGAYGVPEMKVTSDAVDKIMMYQFYENRDQWARMNLLADKDAMTAAEMSQFAISDWMIPGDRKAVEEKMANYYKTYAENPSAVRMRIDPKTGKILNAEAYQKLQKAHNEVNEYIALANSKTAKYKLAQADVEGIQDPTEYAKGQAHLEKQMQTDITQPVIMYPHLTVFDRNNITAPEQTAEQQAILGNYLQNTKYKWSDINAGRTSWLTAFAQRQDVNKDITGDAQKFSDILRAARGTNPQTPDEFRKAILAQPGAEQFMALYDNYTGYKGYHDKTIKDNPALGSQEAPAISLDNDITPGDMISMYIASKAVRGRDTELKPDPTNLGWAELAQRKREAGDANTRFYAGLRAAAAKGPATADYLAQAAIRYLGNVIVTPNKPDAKPDATAAAQLQDEALTKGQTFYEVPVDDRFTQMFQKSTQQKTTQYIDVLDPTTNTMVKQAVKVSEQYPARKAWVMLDPSGDANKNKLVVQYINPNSPNKKAFHQVFDKESAIQAAANQFDNGTAAGGQTSMDVAAAIEAFNTNFRNSLPEDQRGKFTSYDMNYFKPPKVTGSNAPTTPGNIGVWEIPGTNIKYRSTDGVNKEKSTDGGKTWQPYTP